jgi:tRNA(fMet)-specific endonuclease VapC
VIAACERKRWTARQTITHLQQVFPEEMVVPAIAAAELITGIYRAPDTRQADARKIFVQGIFEAWPPMPFSEGAAWIAGRMRGEQSKTGNTLALADSLIAATALELGFAVLTHNVKDFTRVPGLRVVPFVLP